MELKRIKDMVAWELERFPACKNSDWALIMRVYEDFYDVSPQTPFYTIAMMHDTKKLPTFESITRLRRKLQEEDPKKYGASGRTTRLRHTLEVKFYDFIKENEKHPEGRNSNEKNICTH